MFFDDWGGLGRVLLIGALAYVILVAILRLSGKRTLAKMNAFDLVVTVALGSTLATILLSTQVSLAEGVLALALLAGLQYVVAWLAVRSRLFRAAAKSTPRLLLSDGVLLQDALRQERVAVGEVRQAVRSQGHGSLSDIAAVVLETDGSFSVITTSAVGDGTSLADVPHP